MRVMAYHSRQILLLRHEQEKYLDKLLKRHQEKSNIADFEDSVVRKHIDSCDSENILFILVATPVEEVGRDHDWDWAVVEPSSYRSIIQLAGRIRRHRRNDKGIEAYNMAIMQFNLRGLEKQKIAFCRPGYESGLHLLRTHDITSLLNETELAERVDAIPRIIKAEALKPEERLIDLEHQVMLDFNSHEDGPKQLNGWLEEYWWLTALPQRFNPFRESTGTDVKLWAIYKDERIDFCEYNNGKYIRRNEILNISIREGMNEIMKERLWLYRDYKNALQKRIIADGRKDETIILEEISRQYGEIVMPYNTNNSQWYYSDHFGLFREYKE